MAGRPILKVDMCGKAWLQFISPMSHGRTATAKLHDCLLHFVISDQLDKLNHC